MIGRGDSIFWDNGNILYFTCVLKICAFYCMGIFILKYLKIKSTVQCLISLILISVTHPLLQPHGPPVGLNLCTCCSFCLKTILPDSHTRWALYESIWVLASSFNLDLCSNKDLKSKPSTLAILYKIYHLLWSQSIPISYFIISSLS